MRLGHVDLNGEFFEGILQPHLDIFEVDLHGDEHLLPVLPPSHLRGASA